MTRVSWIRTAVSSLLVLGLMAPLRAGPLAQRKARQLVEEGNAAYAKGEFEKALDAYDRALEKVPRSTRIEFNKGSAFYQAGEDELAQQALQRVLNGDEQALKADALFNLGNLAVRRGALEDAAGYYRRALLENPDDLDARYNLGVVLKRMEQQQQEKNGENKDENKNEEDDKDSKDSQEQDPSQQSQGEDPQEQPEDENGEEQKPQPPGEDASKKDENEQEQRHGGEDEPEEQAGQSGKEDEPPPEGQIPEEQARRLLDMLREEEKHNFIIPPPSHDKASETPVLRDW